MCFPLALRHSILLLQHAVTLRIFILGVIITLLLTGQQETSPGLLILCNPSRAHIAARVHRHCLGGRRSFDSSCRFLSDVYSLQGGQEVPPFFVGQGATILIFVLYIIIYVCQEAVL